ncbi:DNA repair protein RecO [Alphaproteobacteria bacterium]|nr:DNA repair protein RecO [Alphaproteobacteria bacterium]
MYKTEAIVTKVENFKENHLSVSFYSTEHGQKSLVVFGGKSKKKSTNYVKGGFNNIEFDSNNVCLSSTSINSFKWFLFSKYELKAIDYFCFLINKLLFLADQNSNVINYYLLLMSKMNDRSNYLSELLLLELEILKTSGYQPDFNQSVLEKIFNSNNMSNLRTNEDIYEYLKNNKDYQSVFFDFMSRIVNRVLINLNINLPFSRNEVAKKN